MDDVNVFSSKRSDLVRIDKCSGAMRFVSCTLLIKSQKIQIMVFRNGREEEPWELGWM